MLIAIVAGLFLIFGGGEDTSIDRVRDAIDDHVKSDEKRERAEARLDHLEELVEKRVEGLNEKTESFFAAMEKKDASREELEKMLDSLQTEREAIQKAALDARFDLRKELSAKEWSKVFAPAEE